MQSIIKAGEEERRKTKGHKSCITNTLLLFSLIKAVYTIVCLNSNVI